MMRIARFAAVGVAAALVHMGAFWAASRGLGLGDSLAWIASFLVAASAAWLLNRRFTFQDRAAQHQPREWLSYLGVAAFGAIAHFLTFHAAIAGVDLFARHPWLAIIPGSAASFAVTYVGASLFVFRSGQRPT